MEESGKASVVGRKQLLAGVIVSIKLPKEENVREKLTPEGTAYKLFCYHGRGGVFHAHLYGEPAPVGKRVHVEARVYRKTMSNGLEYIYLDLYATDKALSHGLKMYQTQVDIPQKYLDAAKVFKTKTHDGAIVIHPLES